VRVTVTAWSPVLVGVQVACLQVPPWSIEKTGLAVSWARSTGLFLAANASTV
jgi:hypothetical protein